MKRYPFSLIEIVVSLPLITILFSFLLLTLTKTLKNRTLLEEKKKEALENHYFQRRLQQKLSHVTRQTDLLEEFFSPEKAIFYFNNGISQDPKAKGVLKGKLFLENNSLMLHLYQEGKTKETFVREEKLLTNVDSLSIDYFFEKKNDNEEQKNLPTYEIILNPNKNNNLTWVGLSLNLQLKNDQKKSYFFNLKRPAK